MSSGAKRGQSLPLSPQLRTRRTSSCGSSASITKAACQAAATQVDGKHALHTLPAKDSTKPESLKSTYPVSSGTVMISNDTRSAQCKRSNGKSTGTSTTTMTTAPVLTAVCRCCCYCCCCCRLFSLPQPRHPQRSSRQHRHRDSGGVPRPGCRAAWRA